LLWAVRKGALIAIAVASVLVLSWLAVGIIATVLQGRS
jgi:hypothetical protein